MVRIKEPKYKVNQIIKDEKRNFIIVTHFIHEHISKGKIICQNGYECKCNICGYISIKTEAEIDRGRRCPCCNNKIVVEGINDIPTVAPWMVKYFQKGYAEAKEYTARSNKKFIPICPDCGTIKDKEIKINQLYTKKSIGCKCNTKGISYPERFMMSVLNQLNLQYIWQFSSTWSCRKRYDFCINSLKLIIETDGALGHGHMTWSGKADTVSKENDMLKESLANNNGYKVIRIDCQKSNCEYIKNQILKSELSDYFDLSIIDFSKCEEQALSNLCKNICLYWEKHQHLSCKQIGELFNCGTFTVTTYLKRGALVGWCSYSVEKARKIAFEKVKQKHKNCKRKSIYDSIPVVGIDKDKAIIYFDSITKASQETGVRPDRINEVCRHRKHYNSAGGYIWRYQDEYLKKIG